MRDSERLSVTQADDFKHGSDLLRRRRDGNRIRRSVVKRNERIGGSRRNRHVVILSVVETKLQAVNHRRQREVNVSRTAVANEQGSVIGGYDGTIGGDVLDTAPATRLLVTGRGIVKRKLRGELGTNPILVGIPGDAVGRISGKEDALRLDVTRLS